MEYIRKPFTITTGTADSVKSTLKVLTCVGLSTLVAYKTFVLARNWMMRKWVKCEVQEILSKCYETKREELVHLTDSEKESMIEMMNLKELTITEHSTLNESMGKEQRNFNEFAGQESIDMLGEWDMEEKELLYEWKTNTF